jgi:steroid delta-isomerase-like uncharacterized protein
MASDAIALAKEGVEVFNQSDWGRITQLSTPNVFYDEVGTGRRVEGPDAFIALSKGWKTAFPDAKGTVNSTLASGDTAVIEVTWTGTQTGELVTPTGDRIPATGKKVKIPAVQIVTTSGGKIAGTRHYFDSMTMMMQLGVVPSGASA